MRRAGTRVGRSAPVPRARNRQISHGSPGYRPLWLVGVAILSDRPSAATWPGASLKTVSRQLIPLAILGSGFTLACTSSAPSSSGAPTQGRSAGRPAEDKQWTMASKNPSLTRYSNLDEINTDNVKDLKVAWTFSTGVLRGHEGEPLVIGNVMYVHTPFPNIVYALDLSKEGAPIIWKYVPKQD